MKNINKFIFSDRPGIRLFRHIFFWVIDILNWIAFAVFNRQTPLSDILVFLSSFPIVILTTYFILYYLIPKFGEDLSRFFLGFFVSILCMGFILRIVKAFLLVPFFSSDPNAAAAGLQLSRIIGEIFTSIGIISLAVAIKFIKNKTHLQQVNNQLIQEKKSAELGFLRAQMHPHFLFNTLNTLYSETMQGSEKAEQVVLHFANLLRFILEECNKPLIPVKNEIKVIQDYIQLEKLRHGSRLNVLFTTSEIDEHAKISPLLMLPFVENSFKHTLSNIRGNATIEIVLNTQRDKICLSIENDHIKTERKASQGHSGTGIANVRRQLELLFGSNYLLSLDETEGKYKVLLQIPYQHDKTNLHHH